MFAPSRKWRFVLAPIAVAALVAIVGEVVMHLWNWLLPGLFGWRQIGFWQALGLLVLSRILVGGIGGHRHHDRSRLRRKLEERWEQLTPEEREKLRGGLRGSRCGPFGRPERETSEPGDTV
jgi:hypothetical protein